MKNRKWTNKQKLEIVLENLNGRVTISDLCNRH
ncbi:MAG: transposase [Candidatus Omnitrophota bacterium]